MSFIAMSVSCRVVALRRARAHPGRGARKDRPHHPQPPEGSQRTLHPTHAGGEA